MRHVSMAPSGTGSASSLTSQSTRETDYDAWVTDRTASADDTTASLRRMADRRISVVVGEEAPTVAAAVSLAPPNTTVLVPAGRVRFGDCTNRPLADSALLCVCAGTAIRGSLVGRCCPRRALSVWRQLLAVSEETGPEVATPQCRLH
ncbi:hypothetical protein [Haloferax sp. YSSS75]|uniref:hypothetical protein n=1 Tax=Haloferax sp. YSSS75 TaxID=3388564 RepID=UPI00398D21DB